MPQLSFSASGWPCLLLSGQGEYFIFSLKQWPGALNGNTDSTPQLTPHAPHPQGAKYHIKSVGKLDKC